MSAGTSDRQLSALPIGSAEEATRSNRMQSPLASETDSGFSENDEKSIDPVSKLSGKKLLLIAPQPFFTNRGTPINVKAMVEALASQGMLIDLLVYPFGTDLEIPNVTLVRARGIFGIKKVLIGPSWGKILLDVSLLWTAICRTSTNRYDIFHGIEEGAFIAGTLAKLRGKPFIFDLDSNMREQLRDSGFFRARILLTLFARLEGFFLRRASAVLTVCKSLTDFALAQISHKRVFQIEDFPVDSSTIVNTALLSELRSRYGVSGRRFIVYTGNLEYYQGIDLFLRSLSKLIHSKSGLSSPSNAHAIIVGGKPSDIQRCRNLAAELEITDAVSFLGERPGDEMGTYLAFADVLVSPRLHGSNTPLKIFSYMASGAPIVATRILSHTQILGDSHAFLTEPSEQAFASALSASLDQSDVGSLARATKSENARRLIEERYNRARFERDLVALYGEIITE